jgi:hypothetical protein
MIQIRVRNLYWGNFLYNPRKMLFFLSLALQPSAGYGLLVSRGFLITHNEAPQSVGLLLTSNQLVAETSTLQHNTHNRKTSILPVGFEPTIAVGE